MAKRTKEQKNNQKRSICRNKRQKIRLGHKTPVFPRNISPFYTFYSFYHPRTQHPPG
ncbi:hypothetical protein BD777DRAFT_121445 [Yarrowia lipolytica]|nr:hypothetical protein BD777DRAFT_121445 [Yarrowia lipolytica]